MVKKGTMEFIAVDWLITPKNRCIHKNTAWLINVVNSKGIFVKVALDIEGRWFIKQDMKKRFQEVPASKIANDIKELMRRNIQRLKLQYRQRLRENGIHD